VINIVFKELGEIGDR